MLVKPKYKNVISKFDLKSKKNDFKIKIFNV